MSTIAESLPLLDLQHSRRIPMSRLIRVELRKMADTRAGMWLLTGICVLTAAVMTIFLLNADEADRTFMKFMGAAATPQAALLPVLGILPCRKSPVQVAICKRVPSDEREGPP